MAVSAFSFYLVYALVELMLFIVMLHKFNGQRCFLRIKFFFINSIFFVDVVEFFYKSTDCC